MSSDQFTLKELLLEAREDVKEIHTLVAKQEEHLRTMNGRIAKTEARVELVEKRVLQNELFRWKVAGALVVLSILLPMIIQFVIKFFSHG